jgi:hypothetical protein
MISSHKVTKIYFIIDEFFKEFDNLVRDYLLQEAKIRKRNREYAVSRSEVKISWLWLRLNSRYFKLYDRFQFMKI